MGHYKPNVQAPTFKIPSIFWVLSNGTYKPQHRLTAGVELGLLPGEGEILLQDPHEINPAFSKSALHGSRTLRLGKYYICMKYIYHRSGSLPFASQLSLAALAIA